MMIEIPFSIIFTLVYFFIGFLVIKLACFLDESFKEDTFDFRLFLIIIWPVFFVFLVLIYLFLPAINNSRIDTLQIQVKKLTKELNKIKKVQK